MGKSGGAPRKHTQTPSTVSDTCTVAATVQESLWNLAWHILRNCLVPMRVLVIEFQISILLSEFDVVLRFLFHVDEFLLYRS